MHDRVQIDLLSRIPGARGVGSCSDFEIFRQILPLNNCNLKLKAQSAQKVSYLVVLLDFTLCSTRKRTKALVTLGPKLHQKLKSQHYGLHLHFSSRVTDAIRHQ